MLKDLLLPLTNAAREEEVLASAIALAEHHRAHLCVLITVALIIPMAFEWGALPADLYSRLHDEERARAAALAQRARGRLGSSTIPWEVRVVETQSIPSSRTAALHARHSDLTIMEAGAGDESARVAESLFLDLLLDSGRPVLVVPPGHVARVPARHAVVAWQPTREASRALHDALPLLLAAETVDVLVLEPRIDEHAHGEQPGADIATHLARHGLKVRVVVQPDMGETTAGGIMRHVLESGAELLVAGGFSHSRFREQILGGVTQSLLDAASVPTLFAH